MRRQLGLRRGEPVEEQLRRARSAAHEAVAEPDPRRAEAVSRDLVDRARVEVVDEGVGVAVERIGADGRQGHGDRVERLLHRIVDRGAPVGEPRAAAVLQLRVEEALRHRSGRQLENGEGRPGRAPGLEVRRRRSRERDQLLEADAARGGTVPEVREIGDGGDPDVERSGRERPVPLPRETVALTSCCHRISSVACSRTRSGGVGAAVGTNFPGYGLRRRARANVFSRGARCRPCPGVSPSGRPPSRRECNIVSTRGSLLCC